MELSNNEIEILKDEENLKLLDMNNVQAFIDKNRNSSLTNILKFFYFDLNIDWTKYAQEIPAKAFADTDIQDIEIGSNIKKLGEYAFQNCQNLEHLRLSKCEAEEIPTGFARNSNKLKAIKLNPKVKRVNRSAFTAPDIIVKVGSDPIFNESQEWVDKHVR